MESEQPSTSSRPPLPAPKPNISSVSEQLTDSEIEALRRDLREKSAWLKKEFKKNPPI